MITLGERKRVTDAQGLWGTAGIPPSQERYRWPADSSLNAWTPFSPVYGEAPSTRAEVPGQSQIQPQGP